MKRTLSVVLALTAAIPLYAGSIRISGASVMAEVNQKLAKAYMAEHPETKITISVSNCTTGLADLAAGSADIASTVRPINIMEIKKLPGVTTTIVGMDGLTIYVNPANPVKALTATQINGIFTGAITDWKAVGGVPGPIHVVKREEGSGCQVLLRERMLKNAAVSGTKQANSASAMLQAIAADPAAIGFAQWPHGEEVKPVAIIPDGSPVAIATSAAAVVRGVYPMARNLHYYARPGSDADVQGYLKFVRSPEGQKIVSEAGFFLKN